MRKWSFLGRGVISVEMLFAVSIATVVLTYSLYAVTAYIGSMHLIADKAQGLYLAEEGLEMIRFVRDEGWATIDALTPGHTYYLSPNGSSISINDTTPEVVEGFTRSFTVTDVQRNGSDDIVTSGGTDDSSSVWATVTVTGGRTPSSVSLMTLLADHAP